MKRCGHISQTRGADFGRIAPLSKLFVAITLFILVSSFYLQTYAQNESSDNAPNQKQAQTSSPTTTATPVNQIQPSPSIKPTPSPNQLKANWMSDQRWTFVGIIISFVALLAAIVIPLRQRTRKELSYAHVYDVLTNPLVMGIKGEENRLKILFDDKPVVNLTHVTIRIYNSGNQPIPAEDFIKPVTFNFGEKAKVLNAKGYTTPSNIETSLSQNADNELEMKSVLLNPSDAVTLFFLVAGFKGDVAVNARVVGISQMKGLNLTAIEQTGIDPHPRLNSWFLQIIIISWGISYLAGGELSRIWGACLIGQSLTNIMNLMVGRFSLRKYLFNLFILILASYLSASIASYFQLL